MGLETPGFESAAFSYVTREGLSVNQIFAHELGHNMGCAHNRASYVDCPGDCNCSPGAFNYSFGHNFQAQGRPYRTIMANSPGSVVDHFSNPFVLFNGTPTGISQLACGFAADNAASINMTKDTVARFRNSLDTSNTTTMASADEFAMVQGNGVSSSVAISENGQYTVFASAATNFAQYDSNGSLDIFGYNRESGIVKLISRANSGTAVAGNGASSSPAITGTGRFITFASAASDVLPAFPGDSNGLTDVFVYDQVDLSIRRVNLSSAGDAALGGHSGKSSISGDGRRVVFESEATNLAGPGGDANGVRDIFVRYRDGNGDGTYDDPIDSTTERVNVVNQTGAQAEGGPSFAPSIASLESRFVAFESDATNLVPGDMLNHRDIFVRELDTFLVERVSVKGLNIEANGDSYAPSISPNGQLVAFESDATNLVIGDDDPGYRDIFLRDWFSDQTIRISIGHDGSDANGHSYAPQFSGDGNYVVFHSEASNLLPGNQDNNLAADVFLYERETGEIRRVNINASQQEATGGGSIAPAASFDARFIAFESDATNLVSIDEGPFRDVFLRDRGPVCPPDLDWDGDVDADDLAILLAFWGPCPGCASCIADLSEDGTVDADDLAILLGAWGSC